MAVIDQALRAFAKLLYKSYRGQEPEDDGVDFDTEDLDSPTPALKAKIIARIKQVLQRRQAWLARDKTKPWLVRNVRNAFKRPAKWMREIRYVQGETIEGPLHGNFSKYVFVNCDVTKAEFVNCNMTQCIFFQCTQIDAGDPTQRLRIYSVSPGRANLANCIGLDDNIIEDLVENARTRIAYVPIRGKNIVGWRMRSNRVAGLQLENDEDEPVPTTTAMQTVGAAKLLAVKRVAGKVKRVLQDYSAGEE